MFCFNCGKEISGAVNFCPHCGADVQTHASPSNTSLHGAPTGPPQFSRQTNGTPILPTQKRPNALLRIIPGVAGVLYALFLAGIYSTGIADSPILVCISFALGVVSIILGLKIVKEDKLFGIAVLVLGIIVILISCIDLYVASEYAAGVGDRWAESHRRVEELERLLN
jgi:hypothetical protein